MPLTVSKPLTNNMCFISVTMGILQILPLGTSLCSQSVFLRNYDRNKAISRKV